MRHAPAAIVSDDREPVEAEMLHHLDLIEGHRSLRVVGVSLAVRRLAAVAVPAQVGRDHRVALRELRRDDAPRDVGLGCTMQQQQRRPGSADHTMNRRARGLDVERLEAGKKAQRIRGGLLGRRVNGPPEGGPHCSRAGAQEQLSSVHVRPCPLDVVGIETSRESIRESLRRLRPAASAAAGRRTDSDCRASRARCPPVLARRRTHRRAYWSPAPRSAARGG